MTYRLVGDGHTERQVREYLVADGHDAELAVDVSALGPGTPDREIRRYALEADRLVITSHEGLLRCDLDGRAGLPFQPDDELSAHEVATVVTRISDRIARNDITDRTYVMTGRLR
jgi:hypothetical protein